MSPKIHVNDGHGNTIGYVRKTDGEWESVAYISEIGHAGFSSMKEAIEDVKELHNEVIYYTIKTSIAAIERLRKYLPGLDEKDKKEFKKYLSNLLEMF